jgi:hypothetical protein
MTPRSSGPGGEPTPFRGAANLRLIATQYFSSKAFRSGGVPARLTCHLSAIVMRPSLSIRIALPFATFRKLSDMLPVAHTEQLAQSLVSASGRIFVRVGFRRSGACGRFQVGGDVAAGNVGLVTGSRVTGRPPSYGAAKRSNDMPLKSCSSLMRSMPSRRMWPAHRHPFVAHTNRSPSMSAHSHPLVSASIWPWLKR